MTLPKLRTGTAGFFSGGRAPACWQREISRPAEAPQTIERPCRWLQELARRAPRLHDEPLLGRCLQELLDAPPVMEEPAPVKETRRPQRETKPAAPARTRPPRPQKGPAGDHEHGELGRPAEQPARASQALLEQHASPRKGRRRGQSEQPAKGPARKQTESASKAQRSAAQHAAAGKDQTTVASKQDGGAWAGRLAEGVRRRAWPRIGETTAKMKRELPDLPGGGLAAQWQRLLGGETVPAGKLEQLARAATGKGQQRRRARADGTATRALKDEPESEGPLGRSRKTEGPASRRARRAGGTVGRSGDDGPDEAAHGEGVAVEPAQIHEMGRYEPVDERSLTATRFQPPQMAERLPPLRPPLPNGLAIPAAAAAAAHSAREEAAAAGDDLEELARKLNRILEEESRRFGIDV